MQFACFKSAQMVCHANTIDLQNDHRLRMMRLQKKTKFNFDEAMSMLTILLMSHTTEKRGKWRLCDRGQYNEAWCSGQTSTREPFLKQLESATEKFLS